MELIAGQSGAVETGRVQNEGDRLTEVVTVKGPIDAIRSARPERGSTGGFCPDGFTVESTSIVPEGDGGAILTINCVNYGDTDAQSTNPIRTTFSIEMVEEVTELKNHPNLTSAYGDIVKWLATDPSKRTDGTDYYYLDGEGNKHQINNEDAKKFFVSYMAGITTYIRYFPVINKISYYRRAKGLTMSGNSVIGGTAKFAGDLGKWSSPGIALEGYANEGWWKSKDSWVQGFDLVWTRTEQWTWTPNGSSSAHGWIYARASDSQGT